MDDSDELAGLESITAALAARALLLLPALVALAADSPKGSAVSFALFAAGGWAEEDPDG